MFWARRVHRDGWQFPQGGMNTDETPLEAMYRELREETGLLAESVIKIGEFYASPGVYNEVIHIYFASSEGIKVVNPRLIHLKPPFISIPSGVRRSKKVTVVITTRTRVGVPI